jgi:hypothetical protein
MHGKKEALRHTIGYLHLRSEDLASQDLAVRFAAMQVIHASCLMALLYFTSTSVFPHQNLTTQPAPRTVHPAACGGICGQYPDQRGALLPRH